MITIFFSSSSFDGLCEEQAAESATAGKGKHARGRSSTGVYHRTSRSHQRAHTHTSGWTGLLDVSGGSGRDDGGGPSRVGRLGRHDQGKQTPQLPAPSRGTSASRDWEASWLRSRWVVAGGPTAQRTSRCGTLADAETSRRWPPAAAASATAALRTGDTYGGSGSVNSVSGGGSRGGSREPAPRCLGR